jgi:hypothetical protein
MAEKRTFAEKLKELEANSTEAWLYSKNMDEN